MMLAATASLLVMVMFYANGLATFVPILALVGFTCYGPDALLTGAGAIDIGGRRSATFAAAVISGFGSMGSIVQELVIARVYDGDLLVVFDDPGKYRQILTANQTFGYIAYSVKLKKMDLFPNEVFNMKSAAVPTRAEAPAAAENTPTVAPECQPGPICPGPMHKPTRGPIS